MTFSSFKILTTAFPIPSTPYQLANQIVSLKISQPCWLCLSSQSAGGLPQPLFMGHPSNIFICLLLFNSDRGVQANLNLQRYFNFYQKHLKSLFANPVYSSSGVIFSFLSNRDQVSFLLCNSSSGPFLGAFSLATCMDIPDQLPKTQ